MPPANLSAQEVVPSSLDDISQVLPELVDRGSRGGKVTHKASAPKCVSGGVTQPPPTGVPVVSDSPEPIDPFDLSALRLKQDFASQVGVKTLITTVRVQKPSKEIFVRCHPDEDYRIPTAVIELKDENREIYLVAQPLWPDLVEEATFSPRLLVTSISRQGDLFLWPIRLPGPDGKIDEWNRSALEAADAARDRWVRVRAKMSQGAYEISVATGDIPEPVWPDLSFQEIIKIAFKDRMITSMDHPVLRRLRGEI